ncbi:type IV pilus modification protein PilV [Nitrospira sp. Nam74]
MSESTNSHDRHSWGQAGFTLLESMIAAIVLAVGLMALAGMQGIALSRNVDANELTLASNLAADMVERIQYNRRNAIVYTNIDTSVASTQPTTNTMARGDYTQWKARLESARLGAVRGRVTVNDILMNPSLKQSAVTVQVQWTGNTGSAATARTRTVTLNAVVAPE